MWNQKKAKLIDTPPEVGLPEVVRKGAMGESSGKYKLPVIR